MMQLIPSSGNQYDHHFFSMMRGTNELTKYILSIYYIQDLVLKGRDTSL